jgi:hypothetical protein
MAILAAASTDQIDIRVVMDMSFRGRRAARDGVRTAITAERFAS